ncbi:MAG: right-handed parallel beta-helix repeat-containing protein, partial [Candidatus Sumerlaeota bacterium]|nr:right-handed parallel beta-helix repeat-containing protein [Candidatus Sumerlaeota bacterium]
MSTAWKTAASQLITSFCLALFIPQAWPATNISGDVSGTWTKSGGPYNLTGDAHVPSGQTLTIEAGVQIVAQGSYHILVEGKLLANGTELDRVIFTASSEIPGAWQGLIFSNSNSGSALSYCDILYAGAWDFDYSSCAAVHCLGTGAPRVDHCIIAQSNRNGIESVNGGDPVLSDCIISDNSGSGIVCNSDAGITVSACTVSTNGEYGVICPMNNMASVMAEVVSFGNGANNRWGIFGSQLTQTTVWPQADFDVLGSISVASGNRLTLSPGSRFYFAGDTKCLVNGSLLAQGTETERIIFSSDNETRGAWQGLNFSNSDSGSALSYCDILYAGAWDFDYSSCAAVHCLGTGAPRV